MTRDARGRGRRLVRATAVLSASVLAFEIALMRVLLVASWHHFAFLVISLALLGFGVSGTVLALARPWLLRAPARWLFAIVLATAVAMVACTQLAQRIEVEAAIVPALLGGQVARWLLYWGLLTIPFLLGAAGIGLALMAAGDRIGAVYGANLLGSATGAIAAPGLMVLLPPAVLPAATALVALLAAVPLRAWTRPGRAVAWLAVTAGLAGWLLAERPHVRPDPWKDAALLARLQAQGSAWRIAMSHGPRSLVEAWGSDLFHDVPFAGPDTVPPPIAALVQDGHRTGAVLQVDSAAEAAVMDGTLMALPYELAPARPRVALLGATGGANAWLAVRRGASETLFVQPDGRLLEVLRLLRGPPAAPRGGAVLEAPSVRVAVAEPRHFVERPPGRFDVIQLVGLQGTAAGTGGVGGLGQDHLVTVEGLTACLEALTDDGVLFACRGIQTPPRDNVKLLATLVEALRRTGRRPGRHLVVVRDFLGVCTIARSSPWTADDLARVRAACAERQLTPVWFEGIGRDELNRPDALPGPEPGVDWYTEATRRLLSPEAASFIDAWAYDIRPPTDDRPFFHDFCRLGSLGALRDAYGDLWLTRTELAFLFVIAATGAVAVAGAVLILTPL
ncbi:MAG: spermidine synthase family protein, partial [Planctomycetota bacterium]